MKLVVVDGEPVDGAVPPPPEPPHRRRLTRRRVLLAGSALLLLIALLAIGPMLSVRNAANEARAGRDAIGELRGGFDFVGSLDESRASFSMAQRHFGNAVEHLDSWWMRPVRWLPFIGTQIDASDALASAGVEATSVAVSAIEESQLVIDGGVEDRLAVIERLGDIATRARTQLASVELGPTDGLSSQLREVHTDLTAQLDDAEASLAAAVEVTNGVRRVLEGPTSYLLLVGNNAEMRSGSGSFLSAGVVTFTDADIEVEQLASVHDYEISRAAVLDTAPSTDLWTDITHTTDWQLLGASPRFEWSAETALRMWENANGDRLSGVIAVDAAVLQSLLEVTGPVEVAGRRFTADNVLFEILYNQYFAVTRENYEAYSESQIQRRDRLGALARETLVAMEDRDIDLEVLISQLRTVVEGRHLMIWSEDNLDLWKTVGVDGALGADSVSLSLLNAGGNKLDFWTEVFAEIVLDEPTATMQPIELRTRVIVDPPPDAPRYVVGPHPGIGENPGDYLGVMVFALPADAQNAQVSSGQTIRSEARDGANQMVLVDISTTPEAAVDVVLTFEVPLGRDAVRIEPSARIPAIRWLYGDDRWRSGPAVDIPFVSDD